MGDCYTFGGTMVCERGHRFSIRYRSDENDYQTAVCVRCRDEDRDAEMERLRRGVEAYRTETNTFRDHGGPGYECPCPVCQWEREQGGGDAT